MAIAKMYASKKTATNRLTGQLALRAGVITLPVGEEEANFDFFDFGDPPVTAYEQTTPGAQPTLITDFQFTPWTLDATLKDEFDVVLTDTDGDGIPDILFGQNFAKIVLQKKDSQGADRTGVGDNEDLFLSPSLGTIVTDADLQRGAQSDDMVALGEVKRVADKQPTNITGAVITAVSSDTNKSPQNQPTNVTGVKIKSASSDTPIGTDGVLTFTFATKLLSWEAPTEATPGTAVDISAGGVFTLTANGGSTLVISVTAASLPGSDKSDANIDIDHGELVFVAAGTTLTWAAPGDAAGGTVNVGAGGSFVITSAGGQTVTVQVTAGSLPLVDKTDSDIAVNDNKAYTTSQAIDAGTAVVIVLVGADIIPTDQFTVVTNGINWVEGNQPDPDDGKQVQLLYLIAIANAVRKIALVNGTTTVRWYASADAKGLGTLTITTSNTDLLGRTVQLGFV